MSLDDLVLRLQRWLDRLVRRLYRGRAPEATRRRVLIVQIDGLSRSVLTQALTDGTAPFLARLVRHQGWRLTPRSEEHTSELQSQSNLVCRLLLEKKKKKGEPTSTP